MLAWVVTNTWWQKYQMNFDVYVWPVNKASMGSVTSHMGRDWQALGVFHKHKGSVDTPLLCTLSK